MSDELIVTADSDSFEFAATRVKVISSGRITQEFVADVDVSRLGQEVVDRIERMKEYCTAHNLALDPHELIEFTFTVRAERENPGDVWEKV